MPDTTYKIHQRKFNTNERARGHFTELLEVTSPSCDVARHTATVPFRWPHPSLACACACIGHLAYINQQQQSALFSTQ